MDIWNLTKVINFNYFDYQKLSEAITSSHIRRDIGNLIRAGHIIRVKKGLYIWGEHLRRSPYSKEILSNLIYGPSYVSLEYALSHHGLIPEQVSLITAVTTQKNKYLDTPIGVFEYRHLNEHAYSQGVARVESINKEFFLMATPEKALLDYIALRLKGNRNKIDFDDFIFEDLRIDELDFNKLSYEAFMDLSKRFKSKTVQSFSNWLRKRGARE